MGHKPYRSLIDECLQTECPANHWCLLKEIILASRKLEPRFLVQMKCIEIHKWNMGKELHKPVEWDEALAEWDSKGYARCFAEVYDKDPDADPTTVYVEVMKCKERTNENSTTVR